MLRAMTNTSGKFKPLLGQILLGVFAFAGLTLAQGGNWETKAPMPTARFGSAAGVIDGKLYVAAGCCLSNVFPYPRFTTLEVYDPDTDAWTAAAPIPTAVYGAAVGVIDGKLHVAGGQASQIEGNNIATHQVYDPSTDTWSTKAPMPFASSAIAAAVINGKLYAAGGMNPSNTDAVDALRVYDAATDTWAIHASMPSALAFAGAGVVDGILFVVGGSASGLSGAVASVEAYDPATDTWTTMASAPAPRYLHGVGVVDGILYAVGGFDGSPVSSVDAYDPTMDTWTTMDSLPTARILPAVGTVNGILYVAGGTTDGISHLSALEAFTPRDTTPPETTITSAVDGNEAAVASAGSTLSHAITFTLGGTDDTAVTGFQCSLDGAAYALCPTTVGYSALAPGSHTLDAAAFDAAGNVDPTPASFAWTVLTPAQATRALISAIRGLGLPGGLENSLIAPLNNFSGANNAAACGKLSAFINQTAAKTPPLTSAQAAQLVQAAVAIRISLSCQ